jgi:hypothetical protein
MNQEEEAEGAPPEIISFAETASRVPGVVDIDIGLNWLEGITIKDLSLPAEYALLPHLAIMRSNGGQKNEAVIRVEIIFEKSLAGWVGLEFLSWWVRDLTRSGMQIQLRPIAFPPQVGARIQLGHTLKFYLEIFVTEKSGNPLKVARQLKEYEESLSMSLRIYAETIQSSLTNQ